MDTYDSGMCRTDLDVMSARARDRIRGRAERSAERRGVERAADGGAIARRLALTLALAAAALGASPTAASAMSSLENPPPGANDFSCRPSPAHPRPVVLVHGLSANMSDNWSYISPVLANEGYCVFALTYGLDPRIDVPVGGVIPIEQSAPELEAFVDRVLEATGAPQIDLVGHSEGTVMPQYWLKFLGGAALVKRYVAMTPLYDGTQLAGLDFFRDLSMQLGLGSAATDSVAQVCGSCPQFLRNSELMQKLRSGGGPAVEGVGYTTIPTKYDELVNPWQSGLLDAPNAANMVLQDVCANDTSEHLAEAFDPVVAQIILNSLDPSRSVTPDCSGGAPHSAAGPGLIETDLRGFARGFRLRRLTLRSLPAGARVKLSCDAPKRGRTGGDARRGPCPRTRSFEAARTSLVRKLRRPFKGRHLVRGTRIRVAVTAPDLRGKEFTLAVNRKGRARPKLRCTGPAGGAAGC